MDAEWIKSPTARRIVLHWADRRPAWLWSHEGTELLWRNAAARAFNGKIKKTGLKLGAEPLPIKGQVSRLIRLGSIGRSSLSRVQFLAGAKPVAATCSCTPLTLPGGSVGLLLVGVDPVAPDLLEAASALAEDSYSARLLPKGADYLLVEGGRALRGTPHALSTYAAAVELAGLPEASDSVIALQAGQGDVVLLVWAGQAAALPSIAELRAEEGVGADEAPPGMDDLANMPEPMLPLGLEAAATAPAVPIQSDDWVAPIAEPSSDRALSSLFDRLADDSELYTTLTAADDVFEGGPAMAEPLDNPPVAAISPPDMLETVDPGVQPGEPDMIATVIEYSDDPEILESPIEEPRSHWLITGRGFRRKDPETPPPIEAEAPAPPSSELPSDLTTPDAAAEPPAPGPEASVAHPPAFDPATDPEIAERVSRYNFEELGRILTDRVSAELPPNEDSPPAPRRSSSPESVVNLNAETLVLNRLPLAIMVFRDQQVLFANRALVDLLGHDGVESVRGAGLSSIFPDDETADAGPINRLMRRDGTLLPVTARLQSVSWQGRAALMLSATPTEPIRGHEGAVRAFAEIAAEAREQGFLVADRAGTVTQLSGHGSVLLGRAADEVVGKPLAILVRKPDTDLLRQFLEKPARFAETTRPSLVATSEDGNAEIALFAEGQAGIVTGYFGFVSKRWHVAAAVMDDEMEPGMLGRLSRGIRRPLNTIIGFADLLGTASPGQLDRNQTIEYARDIRTAGLEIAVLADELDDFTRLRDGRYAPRRADVDLGALLESCIVRVRGQAGAARVLVRSAISQHLPQVHADRASLGQALLNLLASAIDQTPVGGSVILSAQHSEDGSIAIHVRDGAQSGADFGERFVVFRDGVDKDGEQLGPVRSSVGLALTRSLLAVNACSLSVDPTAGTGTLFSLLIPADLLVKS